jgi:hypothetical protein
MSKHLRLVFPRLAQNVYAVYVEGRPKAKLAGLFATKKKAQAKKREIKHKHAVSLKGGSILRVTIVLYERTTR